MSEDWPSWSLREDEAGSRPTTQRNEHMCCKKCGGSPTGRGTKPRPGPSSCWNKLCANKLCHVLERPPLDVSCMRKATASNRTARGATRAMRYANAKMGSTACMILMLRKKSLIERAYQLAEACGIPLWNQDEAGPY